MSCQWPGLAWSKLRLARLVAWIAWVLSVEACTYLAHVAQQSELVERQQRDPSLGNLKHLLDSETLYVYGRIVDPKGLYGRQRVAVGAFAEAFGKVELVDVMQNASVGTHYGLNLPLVAGQKYLLLALLDRGEDGHFDAGDVIGQRSLAFAVNEYTFEFRGGFVQAGYQRFIGTGAVLGSPEVQFVGSFSTAGTSLSFDVDRCDSADFDLPSSIPYSANATSLTTIERAADGSTILITYTRS